MDQRDQYMQKYNSLNEELTKLKKQKKTLSDKKSPETDEFLRENQKLQVRMWKRNCFLDSIHVEVC